MYTVRISSQVPLHPDRLKALEQAMGIRKTMDSVIMRSNFIKCVKEKVEYFPLLEDYGGDGLRLKVWVEFKGKNIERLLKRLHRRNVHAYIEKEV